MGNPKLSAGLLMYKRFSNGYKFFLVHPGGSFFREKQDGFWGIPKGGVKDGEAYLAAAKREFKEETGIDIGEVKFIELGSVRQKSGKEVHAWAFEGDWNGLLISNYFNLEWPYKSGKYKKFPEVDKAGFFSFEEAKEKMNPEQFELVERLIEKMENMDTKLKVA